MPYTYCTMCSPSTTSARASSNTLPLSRLNTVANDSTLASISPANRPNRSPRLMRLVRRQGANARRAAATATPASAAVPRGYVPTTSSNRAGLMLLNVAACSESSQCPSISMRPVQAAWGNGCAIGILAFQWGRRSGSGATTQSSSARIDALAIVTSPPRTRPNTNGQHCLECCHDATAAIGAWTP